MNDNVDKMNHLNMQRESKRVRLKGPGDVSNFGDGMSGRTTPCRVIRTVLWKQAINRARMLFHVFPIFFGTEILVTGLCDLCQRSSAIDV